VGKTRAPAGTRDATSEAHVWARLNKDKLPRTYDELAPYPLAYRRAIFVELTPAERSTMWCEHLAGYRAGLGGGLSPDQVKVLGSAMRLAHDHAMFTPRSPGRAQREKALSDLREAAITAFGNKEAKALLATLGPAHVNVTPAGCPGCECSTQDDYCWPAHCCPSSCGTSAQTCLCSPPDSGGCGTFWSYDCNGMCGGWPGGSGCPGRCG
jgi:hypothetical protein